MVSISEVVEGSEIDREDSHGRAPNSHGRHDPRHGWERGPAEPKHANGQEYRFNTNEVQSTLSSRSVEAETGSNSFLIDTDDTDQDHTNTHGSENGTALLDGEVVVRFEDEWHGAELQI